MIRLDATTRSLGIVLGGAVAANELNTVVSFTEKRAVAESANAYLLGITQLATTNGATDVTICDAPAQNVVRDIDYLSVRNRDTAAVTMSIEYDNGGTDSVLYSVTLAVGDLFCYTDMAGVQIFDSSGRLKSSAGVGLPGSSTDNAIVRWDGTGGTTIQNSSFVVDDSGHVTSFGGNIAFPATQSASAGANVLDDYEEGTFTPAIGFATAGDQNIAYAAQSGRYTKIGREVFNEINLQTSTFTHTTAAGNFQLTGLPFTPAATDHPGHCSMTGWTKAGYAQIGIEILSTTTALFLASGSALSLVNLAAGDMPTGGTVIIRSSFHYKV